MNMNVQQAKEWCKKRGVVFKDYEKDAGEHWFSLRKDEKHVEFRYEPNDGDSREVVLGRAVETMKQWLDNGIAPFPGL